MEKRFSTKKLLALRKLTRSVSDLLRAQVLEYLSTLGPLLRPRNVLGDHVQSIAKQAVKGADEHFKELSALYDKLAGGKPFNLPKEFKDPIEVVTSVLELTPVEEPYAATAEGEKKSVSIVSPLKWVLTFSGFGPKRLKELLAERNRTGDDLQQCVLHSLMIHFLMAKQPGLTSLLADLNFPVTTCRLPECGDLPVTCLSSTVPTLRPPDDVIIESTEISGMDAFEEVVDLDQIPTMPHPLRDRLMELVKSQGDEAAGGKGA